MASTLRPQFFCTRPNGTLTPLVAVDELPSSVSLRGVPRVLSPNETQGMTSLGTVNPRSQSYVIEGVPPLTRPASTPGNRAREGDLQTSLMRLLSDENVPPSQRQAVSALLQTGVAQNWFINPATSGWLVPNGNGHNGHVGSAGNAGSRQGIHYNTKKEYCSYWIRHGECDYQQQGCLYKHEMPNDPATLEKLGLRDIPRWYREKYGISSLLPNGHVNSRPNSQGQTWKDTIPDRTAIKSIQYPSNGATNGSENDKNSKHKAPGYVVGAQQNPAMLPGPQTVYAATNSPKAPDTPKHGVRYGPNQHGSKRIDLLSFSPLGDYQPTPIDPMGGNVGGFVYPPSMEQGDYENVEGAHREDYARNIHGLVPNSMTAPSAYLPGSVDTTQAHGRSRKAQKSRRLYQPRSSGVSEFGQGKNEPETFKGQHTHATASSSVAPSSARGPANSQLGSPFNGGAVHEDVSSGPPTRGSPSPHSGASMSSDPSSPRAIRNPLKDREPRSVPSAIGSKKDYCRKSPSSLFDNDFFGLGAGHSQY